MIPWQTNAKCSCITTICKMSHKGGINLKHQGIPNYQSLSHYKIKVLN